MRNPTNCEASICHSPVTAQQRSCDDFTVSAKSIRIRLFFSEL